MSKSREKTKINCGICNKEMLVRNDYIKKHSGTCISCQKLGNSCAKKHGDYKTRLFGIWQGLFHRRYRVNPDVCDDWHSYEWFKGWSLVNGYLDSLTIDRIDNSLGYFPGNCQWITLAENAGKDKIIFSDAEKISLLMERFKLGITQVEFAKLKNVSRNTIQRAEKYAREVLENE